MAYLLRLATNGYAQLASTFSVAGTSSLSIKFKAAFTSGVASEVYGLGTSTAERLQYNGTGFFFRLNGTNGNTITTATIATLVSGYSVSNSNEYELRKILFEDGSRTRYRLYVNGVDCGILMSIFGSGGDTFQFSRIGSASTAFMNGDLYYMDCFVDGVKTRSYDPSATGGSGSTLVDTTGSQNGTLNGTYSWIFYSSGGTSWEGTIGKTSLSTINRALSINTGQLLSTGFVSQIPISNKQLNISTGFVATSNKSTLILTPKQESINAGYINVLSKLGLSLLQKQLSISVGANLPFTGTIGKTTFTLAGKQLGVSAGWNSGVTNSSLTLNGKQESVLAGFVNTINELTVPVNGKPLNLQTGTSISYVGTISKSDLNAVGKPLSLVTGTAIPFVGLMQKTSLTLSGKQLGVVRGQVLELQKQALNIVGKSFTLGEYVYPITPIERIFELKDGDRIHYFKQTTTVFIMKNN